MKLCPMSGGAAVTDPGSGCRKGGWGFRLSIVLPIVQSEPGYHAKAPGTPPMEDLGSLPCGTRSRDPFVASGKDQKKLLEPPICHLVPSSRCVGVSGLESASELLSFAYTGGLLRRLPPE